MRAMTIGLVLAAGAVGDAAAQTRLPGPAVEVVHAAARLTVIPEDRADVAVELTGSTTLPTPTVRQVGDKVVIDGGLFGRIRGCRGMGQGQRAVVVTGVGLVPLSAAPAVTVRMPRTVRLAVGGGVAANVGASAGGTMRFLGCGDATVGPASGPLEVQLEGSGDVTVADVAGAVAASLDGSGDLVLGATGPARLTLDGSGDLRAGRVGGNLSAELDGSGDLVVAAVTGGSASLTLDGSGDLVVREGKVGRLSAALDGSGNLRFGGRAGLAAATLDGSGDLVISGVDRVESQSKRGSGTLSLGQ